MKLFRHGPLAQERPGIIAPDGSRRDLSGHVSDIAGAVLSAPGLAALRAIDCSALPHVADDVRLGPPVAGTRNFVAIGLNYADHAAETGAEIPSEPVVFLKSLNAIAGPNDPIILPPGSTKTDWEVELAIIIGATCRRVSEADALSHIAGYTICHDVSEREWQIEHGPTLDKGKGFDGFGQLGPWLVTPDEIAEVQDLHMLLTVDGVVMQNGSTRTMIFPIAKLISYVSTFLTLHPGDIITTGTPAGVGLGRKPPQFLHAGQEVNLRIEGLGEQRQNVIGADGGAVGADPA